MAGYVPFGEDFEDAMQIFKEVCEKDLEFPEYLKDKNARKFIEILLNRNAEKRSYCK